VLDKILEATGLDAQTCASLVGISPIVFGEWTAGQRPIPDSYLVLLSDIFGVEPSVLRMSSKQAQRMGDLTPAVWFKFRGEELTDADRECVVLIRQLGHYQSEIEEVTGRKAVGWKPLFEAIRQSVDAQASPSEQGRRAARLLRESTALSQCATGIGDVFRGNLRRLGILVIESPIQESRVEGCCFYVGAHPMERPCVFANSYRSRWFRRNVILMHEIAHAIFDAPSSGASLDFVNADERNEISEQRAQAFAQEALLPRESLNHIAQSLGIKWDAISPEGMAHLVAETHVEQNVVARAAVAAGFILPEDETGLRELDITSWLRQISDRILTTSEYLEKYGAREKQKMMLGKRTTTIPSRSLRLPVPYIRGVIDALQEKTISKGRAAELLMIDKYDLESRFGETVPAAADE
jgi:Zn-dependent peptidase ImmA (M78 family)